MFASNLLMSEIDPLWYETSGLAFDFLYNNYLLRSGGETRGRASDLITFSRASGATVVGPTGAIMWAGHNLVINSAAPVTQTISVAVSTVYTIECTGTGSVALSGAGSGTVSANSPVTVTATTTSLVLTVSGTVSTMWAYRSGLGGMVLNPATASTYYPTSGSIYNAPRFGYDPVTLAPLGLLMEEQRINLLLNSATLSTQSRTVNAITYTLSFFGSGTVTLSGASTAGPLVGAGAYPNRATLTFTPTAGSLTLTVSGTVEFAQLEAGSFATSYIPTLGSNATRSIDAANMPDTSFPLSGTEGTLIAKFIPVNVSATRRALQLDDGTDAERITLGTNSTPNGLLRVIDGNVLQALSVTGTPAANTLMKLAARYKQNDFAISANGAAVQTDTSGTLPTVTTLRFGSGPAASAEVLNGFLQDVIYIPRAMTNAELQAASA